MELFIIILLSLLAISMVFLFIFLKNQLQTIQKTEDTQSLLLLKQSIDQLSQFQHQHSQTISKHVSDQLNQISNHVNLRLKENYEAIQKSHQTIGDRLDHTTKSYTQVQQKLSQLEEANKRIYEVGKDISSLQEILRAPKLRGTLGELFLGDLLSQILPKDRFTLQHRFKSGESVDAVIRFKDNLLVPVDSKFPLESFKRYINATDEKFKKDAKKEFVNSVKKRIMEIQQKYIIPEEGTLDFALMYVPAENVYYEIIIKDEEGSHLADYAFSKRVIPVSPNSFYAYLQTILMGLKGMQIEQNTKKMLVHLSQISQNFEKFEQDFTLIGTHLSRAKNSYEGADKRLEKVKHKLSHTLEHQQAPLLESESPAQEKA